jgi:uncharacterized protein YjbI with pentapeptide repeats
MSAQADIHNFVNGQVSGNEIFMEYDFQAMLDSIDALNAMLDGDAPVGERDRFGGGEAEITGLFMLFDADLSDAEMTEDNGIRIDASEVVISDSDLSGSTWEGAVNGLINISTCDLSDSDWSNCEFSGGCYIYDSVLNGTDFTQLESSDFSLNHSVGSESIWSEAQIYGGEFDSFHLPDADFSNSQLENVEFRATNAPGEIYQGLIRFGLPNANFENAQLSGVSFINVDLSNADFTGATFENCYWEGAYVEGCIGCDCIDIDGDYICETPP